MTPLLAAITFYDILGIFAIFLLIARAIDFEKRHRSEMRRLENKLDLILKHHGITMPSKLSPEVQRLAKDPAQKIAAIKLHREQNPGLGLAEAKAEVEEFA